MITESTFQSFSPAVLTRLVYVYTALALADGSLHEGERSIICSKISEIERFEPGEIEALIDQIQMQISHQTESEKWNNVRAACYEVCQTEADRVTLLSHLQDIIESDGRVQEKEMELYRRISAIMA